MHVDQFNSSAVNRQDNPAKFKSSQFFNSESQNNTRRTNTASAGYEFLNKIRPEQAREFLLNLIGQKVQSVSPAPSTPTIYNQAATETNNASSTASSIISNVNQAANQINQTQDNNQQPQTLSNLIDNIQAGFVEARQSLESYGSFYQGFQPEFDEINQKVDDFLNSLNTARSSTVYASQSSYRSSSNSSIQIETRDGDIVTIDISKSFSQSESLFSAELTTANSQFSGQLYEASSSSNKLLTYSVSGSLDEDELAAIDQVVKDIGQTIKQFEKGNIEAALTLTKKIDLQSSELAAFSFDIQTREQYQAIDLYQRTQTSADNDSQHNGSRTENAPEPSAASTAAQTAAPSDINYTTQLNLSNILTSNISSIIYSANTANINDPVSTVSDLFDKFYQQFDLLSKGEQRDNDDSRREEDKKLEHSHDE